MKKSHLLIFIFIFTYIACFSQTKSDSTNIKIERRCGLSLKVASTNATSLSFDVFITPNVNTEINFNYLIFIVGAGGGLYYHPWSNNINKNASPYIGVHYDYLIDNLNYEDYQLIYIPIGFNYMGDKGFNFAIDIGFAHLIELETNEIKNVFAGSLKFGFRF